MKRHWVGFNWVKAAIAVALGFSGIAARAADHPAPKIRVLLVTGGHPYATNQFLEVFKANPEITLLTAVHPGVAAWYRPDQAKRYDVLVLYDFWQKITPQGKADFVARLKQGKGLVVLHHAIADYQDWPEYERIIGAKYYLSKQVVHGVTKLRSVYREGVHFHVRVVNNQHPVTRDLHDFDIVDENYNLFDVSPRVHVLLTTDAPTSAKTIAWAKPFAAARVVYIQLGHGPTAYANPNYRRLVANAIRWVAHRD